MALLRVFPIFVIVLRGLIKCDHGIELVFFFVTQNVSIKFFYLEILIVKRIDNFRLKQGLIGLHMIKAWLDDCNQKIEHHDQYEENVQEVDYPNEPHDYFIAFHILILNASLFCVWRM
jgi:hypothetical protein